MATGIHQCGSYPLDANCICYGQKGAPKHHFKQFDESSQTYQCCNELNVSLKELRKFNTTEGVGIDTTAIEFFKTINSKGLTGCCYVDYFTDGDLKENLDHFTTNYEPLYTQYLVTTKLYNQFMKESNNVPDSDTTNIKCPDNYFPYILSYKSPDQVYYNNSYICSQTSNDAFINLSVGGKKIDYTIKRFHDNSTGEPCVNSSCQLVHGNFGNQANQGNSLPVSKNKDKEDKTAALASLGIGISIIAVFLFIVFYHYYRNRDNGNRYNRNTYNIYNPEFEK